MACKSINWFLISKSALSNWLWLSLLTGLHFIMFLSISQFMLEYLNFEFIQNYIHAYMYTIHYILYTLISLNTLHILPHSLRRLPLTNRQLKQFTLNQIFLNSFALSRVILWLRLIDMTQVNSIVRLSDEFAAIYLGLCECVCHVTAQ